RLGRQLPRRTALRAMRGIRGHLGLCFSRVPPLPPQLPRSAPMRLIKAKFAFSLCALALSSTHIQAESPEAGLRETIENFSADRGDLNREYDVADSPAKAARFEQFYRQWQGKLSELDFDQLPQAGKIDYLLLANYVGRQQRQLHLDEEAAHEIEPLAPFL